MWLLETAWPPIVILLVLSAVFFSKWKESRKKSLLITSVVMLILTPLIYVVELKVVTENEILEQKVMDFTSNFQQKNLEKTLSFIHEKNKSDEFRVKNSFKVLDVSDDLRITDIRVKISDNGTSGITHFRANASILYQGHDMGHHPSRWNVYWHKADEEWKVIQVDRLDPINGKVIRIPISSFTGIKKGQRPSNGNNRLHFNLDRSPNPSIPVEKSN